MLEYNKYGVTKNEKSGMLAVLHTRFPGSKRTGKNKIVPMVQTHKGFCTIFDVDRSVNKFVKLAISKKEEC